VPFFDPIGLDLKTLFSDRHMFTSREAWRTAGFRVLDRSDNRKIMVAGHPSVPGILFKKYSTATTSKDQREHYAHRVEGADRLRTFVDKRLLKHVAVPHKWIFELPHVHSYRGPSYILAVEQFGLLTDAQTRAAYHSIDPDILRDLCTVLFHFRGMDSSSQNVPIRMDGRIALIDTEHWDRSNNKSYLRQIGPHLSSDRWKLAKTIFDRLGWAGSSFKGTSKLFEEEDTSSGSSSY